MTDEFLKMFQLTIPVYTFDCTNVGQDEEPVIVNIDCKLLFNSSMCHLLQVCSIIGYSVNFITRS